MSPGCLSFSFWMVVIAFVSVSHVSQGCTVRQWLLCVKSFFPYLSEAFTWEDCYVHTPLQTTEKAYWSVCELQIGLCVKISKFRSFCVSWPSSFYLRLQFSQLSSRMQLGSKLPADVPFRTVEYAVTLVVHDGLVGYVSKVICQCCRWWERQGWQEHLLEYQGSSSSVILLCPALRLYFPLSLNLFEGVFARVTKLKEKNMVHDSLMSWVCRVDCPLHVVDRTSVPKPAIHQLLRRRGKLISIPTCCKLCVFSGWGQYWGGESDCTSQKGHWYLVWLLHLNTWCKLCAAFRLFRVWVIFIFWYANKFWLVVAHALLILVQGIQTFGEKCSLCSKNKK